MRWTLLGRRHLETLACALALNGCAVHVVQAAGPSGPAYAEAPTRLASTPTWPAPAPARPVVVVPAPARPAPARPVALAPAPRPLHSIPARPSSTGGSASKPGGKPRLVALRPEPRPEQQLDSPPVEHWRIRKPRRPEAPPVRPYTLATDQHGVGERTVAEREHSTGVAKPQ